MLVSRHWIGSACCLVGGLALGVACLWSQGPLPGDLAVTRALQAGLGATPNWAEFVTATAKSPRVWLTLLLAAALAFLCGGWRGAAVPALAFAGVKILDALLRALAYAPKPSAELVSVASSSASSGFPSTFGLVYGALFGAVLFTTEGRRDVRIFAIAASVALLIVGASARIVLGGHWASQMLASVLLAFSLVLALHAGVRSMASRRPGGPPPGQRAPSP